MSKKKEKGDAYESFSKEVLLLKQISWSYTDKNKNIYFDTESDEHILCGISGAHHQIDVHLTSSELPEFHLLCECKAHNPAVEKTHACSFVTVINDIKEKHPEWKIIPVFTADDGFQSGAFTILKYYKVIALEMKDYRNATRTLSMKVTSIAPVFKSLYGYLEDGTIVDKNVCLENLSRGGGLGITNAIRSFEILDENNQVIKDIVEYVGKFHTGKRTIIYDEYDDFTEVSSQKKLVSIKGEVIGNTSNELESSVDVFKSKVITSINLGDGNIYKIRKDRTCELLKDKNEGARIFI